MFEQLAIIAETRVTDISGRYQDQTIADGGINGAVIAIALIVIAAAFALYLFVLRKPKVEDSPMGLLNELCRAHSVGSRGSRLLGEIAVAAGIEHPATMVLTPSHLDAAIAAAKPTLIITGYRKKILGLTRRQLFEE